MATLGWTGGGPGRLGRRAGPPSRPARRGNRFLAAVEGLERRDLLAATTTTATAVAAAAADPNQLTPSDVATILERAARATASDDAIVAVVDREGNPLGIRVEGNVSPAITGSTEKLVFAIDGALAEARTGAFFGNDQAPLTSRTIQDISQSTIVQQEVQSDPNITDPNSALRGPGFVAPVGKKGHFPPRVMFTPQVDLFQIEHTNRDSILHPGANHLKTPTDFILLPSRFNVPRQYIPAGQSIPAPESYGFYSGKLPFAQARGIGTLPGGVPIFKTVIGANGQPQSEEVGGIGVFFPGTTGFATEENSNLNDAGFYDPTKPDRSVEAEYIAFIALGGSTGASLPANSPAFNASHGLPPLPTLPNGKSEFDLPFGRIDLVGITLDIFGGHGLQGPRTLVNYGRTLGLGDINSGVNEPVNLQGQTLIAGTAVPTGWLVLPHDAPDGSGLTAADVTGMIARGINEANRVRAAIRLPRDSTARMVFAVSDKAGDILGLYRMPDATYFSIDVAVAKARNVAYYANPAELQPIDKLPSVPAGSALTNRTFRYLTEPRFPEGIDINPPGPFSILQETGLRVGPVPKPASSFQTVQGFDAFNPGSNFHDPFNPANQNGIVFFPGSVPLYKDTNGTGVRQLVGGLGVSGDGVDQDDDVTFQAAVQFEPPSTVARADEVFVRGVRLPYQKFNRQPHEPGLGGDRSSMDQINPPAPKVAPVNLSPRNAQRIDTLRRQQQADLTKPRFYGQHLLNGRPNG
jgi:uncharacterized protein GlcG (DUF336 family)